MIDFIHNLLNRKRIHELESQLESAESKIKELYAYADSYKEAVSNQNKLMEKMQHETVITIIRDYHPSGTNGDIYVNDHFICHCIELPWRDNQRQISCIPEGRYEIRKRSTQKWPDHIYVANVPNRSGILFHPANNADTQLQGCIAPVTKITAPGRGTQSVLAMSKLRSVVYGHIDSGKKVFVVIKSKEPSHT